MYDGPSIVNENDPTRDEIRAWAYSGALEPMQDWDIIIAELDNLELLLDLAGDESCPARRYLLGSLYCAVGQSDNDDPRLRTVVTLAEASSDGSVSAWGRRARHVFDYPSAFNRDDWCGWQGARVDSDG